MMKQLFSAQQERQQLYSVQQESVIAKGDGAYDHQPDEEICNCDGVSGVFHTIFTYLIR